MEVSTVLKVFVSILALLQSYFRWSPLNLFVPNEQPLETLQEGQHLAGLIVCAGEGGGGGDHGRPWSLRGKYMNMVHTIPLIGWTANAMLNAGVFKTIWVSTDDQEIADYIMNKYWGHVRIFHRPLSTQPIKTHLAYVQEFLEIHPEVDAIGLVQVTQPYIRPKEFMDSAHLLRKFDSVFSGVSSYKMRWKASLQPDLEPTVQLTIDPDDPRRMYQDTGYEIVENGEFHFAMRNVIMKGNSFYGKRQAYVQVTKYNSLELHFMLKSDGTETLEQWILEPLKKLKAEQQEYLEATGEMSEKKEEDGIQQKISLPEETRTDL